MKKSLLICFSAGVLTCGTFGQPADAGAVVSINQSCPTLNAKIKIKTISYVCTRAGKRLLWDKAPVKKPTPTPTPTPNDTGNTGNLLWSQEFNGPAGTGASTSAWTALLGNGYSQLGFANYGTGEIESNSPSAAIEDGDGNLVITASKQSGVWTSSRLWTQGKVSFQYGQLEARIQLPVGSYNWPALWMLGSNYLFPNGASGSVPWPNSGEIDIMESLANNSVNQSTLHANILGTRYDWNGGAGVTIHSPQMDLTAGFHTFGMLWEPNSISFTLDGQVYGSDTFNNSVITQTVAGTTTTFNTQGVWPFNKPFFLILNNAIPQSATSLPDGTSSQMKVDWIRYYALNGYGQITNH